MLKLNFVLILTLIAATKAASPIKGASKNET